MKPQQPVLTKNNYTNRLSFFFCLLTSIIFITLGKNIFGYPQNMILYTLYTLWLLIGTMISAFQIVKCSDALALKMGEPFGTLVLTLSVTCMEVIIISSVMLSGKPEPTLARDTMYSVVMIVMNGLTGLTLLIGGYRFHTQFFNLMGANAYLAVIIPLALLCLVLPNFLISSHQPVFVDFQSLLLTILSLVLYGVFLLIQTSSHSHFFIYEKNQIIIKKSSHKLKNKFYYIFFLLFYLIVVMILSKQLAVPINDMTTILNAPPALGGFIVALLVLSPEAAGAIKAALSNRLQRAVNIYLGSVLASIALTVPSVLLIGYLTNHTIILGLPPAEMAILIITLMLSQISFAGGKTHVLNGATHLVLFFVYLMIMFE